MILDVFIYLFGLSRALPKTYASSQARGPIGAAAASHSHSHSQAGSEPHLPPTPHHSNPRSLTH